MALKCLMVREEHQGGGGGLIAADCACTGPPTIVFFCNDRVSEDGARDRAIVPIQGYGLGLEASTRANQAYSCWFNSRANLGSEHYQVFLWNSRHTLIVWL